MNDEFEYTAYDGDRPVRTFMIGPSNPSFRPLDRISPLLQMAVMQSEDGSFFYHQGFYPGAIQEALAYDLQVGRFARGGSSITMQLVKNVFLNKHSPKAGRSSDSVADRKSAPHLERANVRGVPQHSRMGTDGIWCSRSVALLF